MFSLFCFFTIASFAQDSTSFGGSSVIVHKDPRVDALVEKQAYINITAKKAAGRTMRGYRLMIVNTNSRDEAISAKTKIYTHFPDQKAYLTYQSPFFKLKAGNYQTRDEAKRYQTLMNTLFPKGVFIVSDIIEVKPEKEAEESPL
ncbi:MAG: SPOR domain-containing protein [Chitinophagaceae bacterium]|nr:MAG: SPOR domain-containing protein [Chitinophagaceae bacterium]